jgi:uncharacterized protein (DUF58 family)
MKYLNTSIRILKLIKTRPTKYFILLVLAIIGLFFLAYMHNYNIVYLVMFFIFSLAGASSIIGRFNLYELEASVLHAQNFFANTSSQYTLSIQNPASRDSFALECTNQESTVKINELKSLQSKTITLTCTPSKRGRFTLPALQIGSYFPLPHEILFREIDLDYETVVYPEPKGESLENFSDKNRAFFGEHDDFEGIRPFREGESLSLIHWPSLAKGGGLMAKEFSLLEQSRHLHFYFSTCADSDEKRLSQLCLWVLECKEKNINFTVHLPSITLNSTQRGHHEILQYLALY